jgi:hypothetical protein
MQEARQRNVPLDTELPDALAASTTLSLAQTGVHQELAVLQGAVLGCASRAQRAQRVLALLVEAAGAQHGYLFLIGENGLARAASSPGAVLGDDARSVVERLVQTTWKDDGVTVDAPPISFAPQEPRKSLWPLLLSSRSKGETQVAGVAALYFDPRADVRLPMNMARAAARVLIDAADVIPGVLGSLSTTPTRD